MIDRLAAIRMPALGFMSAILGSYFPEQTLLDISAGARTWTSLYERDLPDRMALSTRGGGGSIAGWPAALERASTPPAEIVPGALGEAVRGGAGRVAYV